MPHQAIAQRKGVALAVGRGFVLLHHLRLDLALFILREQRVVDHVAVVADDVGRGPDRIQDLQIRVHDGAQRGLGKRRRFHGHEAADTSRSKNCFSEHVHSFVSVVVLTPERLLFRPLPNFSPDYRVDIQLHNTLLTPTTLVTPALRQKSGQPSGQVLSRPAYARRRMDCSPGSAPPTRLLKKLQSRMMPELPLPLLRTGKVRTRHVFPLQIRRRSFS